MVERGISMISIPTWPRFGGALSPTWPFASKTPCLWMLPGERPSLLAATPAV